MAKDRYFSLDLDVNNPKTKECKKRKDSTGTERPADELRLEEFWKMLDNGELTTIGYMYRGSFPSVTGESAAYTSELEPLAQKCIVVYIGGTAYKICS
jgi:hypothetical protein